MTITETNTTPGPGGVSPARAACEAFWAAVGAGPDVQPPTAAWDWAFSQNTTRAWEAAAKAAAAAGARRIAEDIAAAIETSVCEPGDQCVERFCPDCTRYAQAQADAALARKIGGAP